jgi:rhamnopyranosyl-N-acetylglucosaminyl-diphospho-decaprenol beta-1,3/1,4-galactofuranosyltransferase
MSNWGSICALVVTYNRRELLGECLEAVHAQTRAADEVVVVDNASTDGTPEFVRSRFPDATVVELGTNEGSSGGFHHGMKWACDRGFDWLWVMDDDTIPTPTALERLLELPERAPELPAPVILASKVLWTDGSLHPMNTPGSNLRDMEVYVRCVELGVLPLRWNTFPGLLVKREAIERHGVPRKHFFIWSDDIDFTARILRYEPGYMVPASVVHHKTVTPHKPAEGGARFYYAIRNGIFILRGDALAPRERVLHSLLIAEQTRQFLVLNRFRKGSVPIVLRGIRDGLLQRSDGPVRPEGRR